MSHPAQDKRPDDRSTEAPDHFQGIYRDRATDYHRMIAAEDADGNILPALERITLLHGKRVLDLGSGTGRIPLLLSSIAAQIEAIDLSLQMLLVNRRQKELEEGRWGLVQADITWLPVASQSYDLVICGWAIGHQRFWSGSGWAAHIDRILNEMDRAAKPAGYLVILETLGTGATSPAPPVPELAEYYHRLEATHGFSRQEIQTDYQFPSVAQAIEQTRFFFGDELAQRIKLNNWDRLPEWTGIWSRQAGQQ